MQITDITVFTGFPLVFDKINILLSDLQILICTLTTAYPSLNLHVCGYPHTYVFIGHMCANAMNL